MAFCAFIDNHPSEVKEELEGCYIKEASFKDDKSELKLILEKDGIEKELKVTPSNNNWLWLFLTQ